jgi:hypothetical protein
MPMRPQPRLMPVLTMLCLLLAPGCGPDQQGGDPVAGAANERRGGGPAIPPEAAASQGTGGQSSAPGEPNAARK